MKDLHTIQKKLIKLLENNITEPLTIRKLQEKLNLSSPSVVYHHIQQLEKRGYLRRNPTNPKDYQVLANSPDKKITYLNLYGLAHCGYSGSILDGDPIDRISISTKILGFSSSEAFLVKAKGDSMFPKICENDLVIARTSNVANNKDIVICVNDEQTLIKEYTIASNKIILSSFNSKYEPFLAKDDFRIIGLVKSILSYSI